MTPFPQCLCTRGIYHFPPTLYYHLLFLDNQIDGHIEGKDGYVDLYLKAGAVNTAFIRGLSPSGSDISLINWLALYADIACFDAIVPYHPTATAMLVPVEKRLQNHYNSMKN